MRRIPGAALAAAFLFLSISFSNATAWDEYWPGANYDPSIPTVEEILGHESGERITWHGEAIRYFEALAAAAPKRVAVFEYARSWEGRELIYVVITSPENMARIGEIKDGMQRLVDPRKTGRAAADGIIASQPAVTWLSYGVHGNEISSTDAAMMTAYHLLASRNDSTVDAILNDTVVVIDPMQNPDGRDRFIHHFEMAEGLEPSADRMSAEHNEPWPGGRTNHYLFDMNRDWFIMTQPETQGRVRVIQEWYPLAYVDAHEMGSDSTYYFSPEARPFNPHLAKDQTDSLELFGLTNAGLFDRFGIDYFTREEYDAFYPGYGASWPSYYGGIAMTFEQASARGLKVRQYDGNIMTYRDTVRNHFLTSLGTAQTVAQNRKKLLEDFYDYQVTAIEEGSREETRSYIIPTQQDQAGADKMAGLLVQQGVEVERATESFKACGNDYAAGSYTINLAQPRKRMIRTLLDTDVPIAEDWLAEQERRRAKKIRDQIYDVTAWSLPLMMNVRTDACGRSPSVDSVPAGPELVQPGSVSGGEGKVAWLVPWGTAPAVSFGAHGLRQGLSIKSSDLPFTHNGTRYPSGTLILDVADNPEDIAETVAQLASSTGADVVAVDNSWVTDGPNFGSNNVVRFNAPEVAILWDSPTSSYSAGNTRFVIERQLDYPVTAVRVSSLAQGDLGRYDVLILPESWEGYAGAVSEEGVAKLKDWVSRGGVLISIGTANRWVADPNVDLLSIRREDAVVETDGEDDGKKISGESTAGGDEPLEPTVAGSIVASDEEYKALILAEKGSPDSVAGVLVKANVDPDHWLGAGVASDLNVLVRGPDIYTPIRFDKGVNVAVFAQANELVTSGYMWEENRRQMAYKPFAVVQPNGNGFVIAFTQDPNVRAYLDGLNVIFANAIFRGAAHARPVR
jgi:hypothetical protein